MSQNVKIIYQGRTLKVQFDYCPQCKYFTGCYPDDEDMYSPRYLDPDCVNGPVKEDKDNG